MQSKYQISSKEDTYKLIEAAQKGEKEAKKILVEENTGLVKMVATKYSGIYHETDDLIQIGYIGLIKAIEKFETKYNVMFSTYAVPMIIGEIRRFLRDDGKIKIGRSIKNQIYTLHKLESELTIKEGHSPHIGRLAEEMQVSKEHILELLEAEDVISNVKSLDNAIVEEELPGYLSDSSPENRLDSIMVKSEIVNLPSRERKVIVLRYYKDLTQQQIAEYLGISQVQVSRIEKKALNYIKEKLG